MKYSEMRKRIKGHKVTAEVKYDDGTTQAISFPFLSIGDWARIKAETGVDMWSTLMQTSFAIDDIPEAKGRKEKAENMQKNASLNVLKNLDYKIQLIMFYYSMKKEDDSVTMDDVDAIISYGMDQATYMKVLMGLAYGVNPDEVTGESAPLAEKKEQKAENIVKDIGS